MLLWTAKLPSPMKNNPKQQPPANNNQDDLQVGLKTLVHLEAKPRPPHPSIVHNHSLATSSKPSSPPQPPPPPPPSTPSSSFFSLMCDLIGTGSGVCMSSDIDQELNAKPQMTQCNRSSSSKATMTRHYPPSIPLLAQTGNLRGRMPWVFEREYSSDGRLIITAERVKHHEYFEIYRENGRLNMTLVPVDINTVYFDDEEREELEELAAEEEEGGGFDTEEGSDLWQNSSLDNEAEPCRDHVSSGLLMLVGGLGFGPVLESQGNLGCERLLGPDWLGSSSAHDYSDVTLPL